MDGPFADGEEGKRGAARGTFADVSRKCSTDIRIGRYYATCPVMRVICLISVGLYVHIV